MKIKIYRGTHRIGGVIIGISTAETCILVDFGNPFLDTKSLDVSAPDAVVFTHYHMDHAGGLSRISNDIPVYMGKSAAKIYDILHGIPAGRSINEYESGLAFQIGDIKITPILTDHSAFDAYMLLIEGEDERILHTGDFRLHGIRGRTVLSSLEPYKGKINVLITEGTNLSYENPVTIKEETLGYTAEMLMQRYAYNFVMISPENLDRLAVFHKASEAKDGFFCDGFQMRIFEEAKENAKRTGLSALYAFDRAKTIPEDMPKSFVMAVRDTKEFLDIIHHYGRMAPDKSLFIYSMPKAYLKKHKEKLKPFFDGVSWKVMLHTSGHAAEWAIWLVVRTIMPEVVIPVHTENPENLRLGAYQDRILLLRDGEEYDVTRRRL